MKRPEDIFLDKAHVELIYKIAKENGTLEFENNVLVKADVNINAHFGNVVSLDLLFTNSRICGEYNNTSNVGHMIRAVVEVLNKTDDNTQLSSLNGTPVRIIRSGRMAVGFGHFMEDQFVLISDLVKYDGKDDEIKDGE